MIPSDDLPENDDPDDYDESVATYCPDCAGAGQWEREECVVDGLYFPAATCDCLRCGGRGWVSNEEHMPRYLADGNEVNPA